MRVLDARGKSPDDVVRLVRVDRIPSEAVFETAREILGDVATEGDEAVLAYGERFDGVRPLQLVLGRDDMDAAFGRIPSGLRQALEFAARQIEAFHRPQIPSGYEVAIAPNGSRAGQRPVPLARVGVYVPGGPRGYPSSVLMGVIPARLAGVSEVVVATPPGRATALPSEAVLAAAAIAGADEILVAGGAQAIGALAYGTASVRRVDKIVGPGNVYVTAAKLLAQDCVATDGTAGPSEVLVVADASFPPEALAAELLAQAEHDPAATAIALVLDPRVFESLPSILDRRASEFPRGPTILESLSRRGWVIQVDGVDEALAIANALASEHLVLGVRDARAFLPEIRNAGCAFLGSWSATPFGDYTAGTNHILPTAGSARWRGCLSVRDFVKFVTYVEVVPEDVSLLSPHARVLASEEGFEAHAAALAVREVLRREVAP